MHSKRTLLLGALLILIVVVMGGVSYYQINHLQQSLNTTDSSLARTTANLATTTASLTELQEQYDALQDDYDDLKDDYDDYVDEYGDAIKTAKDLAKLATIDPEVLRKYSKVTFLNENYIPKGLKEIDRRYILTSRADQFFAGQALPFLDEMLDEAQDDGIDLKVVSAYRSFDQQSELKGQYTQTYGTGANAFSADQGFSEHQLGTTVDLSDSATNGPYLSFENTDAFRWLERNAYKYGFVLSYPKDNSYYMYEPWHWRFVGEDLARDLRRSKERFYDLDQRKINEYLLEVFD